MAESKYLLEPEKFEVLVRKRDIRGINELLTNSIVEERVIQRLFNFHIQYLLCCSISYLPEESRVLRLNNKAVNHCRARLKAVAFGQDAFSDVDVGFKVDPRHIVALYRDMIIPLTKQVQVRYLFERVGVDPPRQEEWPASLLAYQERPSSERPPSSWM